MDLLLALPAYAWWGLGSLAIVVLAVNLVRTVIKKSRLALTLEYDRAYNALSSALYSTRDAESVLISDPDEIVSKQVTFTEPSLAQYKIACELWAKWLAAIAFTRSQFRIAGAHRASYSAQKWWQLSQRSLEASLAALSDGNFVLKVEHIPEKFRANLAASLGTAQGAMAELPALLEATAAAGLAALNSFSKAIKANNETIATLKNQIEATTDNSILALFGKVQALGLNHPTYQANVSKVQSLLADLEAQLNSDPLNEQLEAAQYLRNKLSKLATILRKAVKMHQLLSTMRQNTHELQTRVNQLRQEPLHSALAEVADFAHGYSFDEPGFVVQEHLDECARLLEVLEQSLNARRLRSFDRAAAALVPNFAKAEQTLAAVLADKDYIDSKLEEIHSASTATDIESDHGQRNGIAASYRTQRWHIGRLQTETLLFNHEKRIAARQSIGDLAAPLSTVLQLLQTHKDVVSFDLDAAFQFIVAEVEALSEQAQCGRADWSALTQSAQDYALRLSDVKSSDSLLRRGEAELAAHKQASEEIAKLDEQRLFLQVHIPAWGGTEAAELLQAASSDLTALLASAALVKQEWTSLFAKAEAVNSLLQEPRRLVDATLALHDLHSKLVGKFEGQLATCHNSGAYEREICGSKFGAALYCHDDKAAAFLPKLKELLEHRDYTGLKTELQNARDALFLENLEAWWLCLQMMASSPVPCACSYAQRQGYMAGAFKTWVAEKMLSYREELYAPPESVCCTKHKGRLSYPTDTGTFDLPKSSDYEGGRPVAG